jgi:protein-disulfide isomerase
MKWTGLLVVLAIVLSLSGAYASKLLLGKHFASTVAPAWVDAVCEPEEGGKVSCDQVLASRWAWIPPKSDSEPKGTVHYPVAGLGLAYFVILLVWFIIIGRPARAGRMWHLIPIGMNALGMLGSIGFTILMAFDLDVWCPLCVATHVINALLLVVNVLLWPRARAIRTAAPDEAAGEQVAPRVERRHPTFRLAFSTVALGVMIVGAMNQNLRIRQLLGQQARMRKVVEEVQESGQALVAMYHQATLRDIELRPDDPIRGGRPDGPLMVVWSDFECGHCGKFARAFESKYRPNFGGVLRVAFKHYPLSPDCNRYSRAAVHPYSCKAARFAEAARMQGGSEKFWEAHDALFEQQDSLRELEPREFAARLGLDPEQFVDDMNSEIVTQRIREDIEQGRSVGVRGTPAVFLDGREIGGLARGVPAFWRLLGQLKRNEWAKQHRGR